MTLAHCLNQLEKIIPETEQAIHVVLLRLKKKLAYSAPELIGGLWTRVFKELIQAEIAPRDRAPWGQEAFICWQKYVPKSANQSEP